MLVADMHCDTFMELYHSESPLTIAKNHLHVDLEKMQTGDYLIQNFAMFIHQKPDKNPLETCLKMIDLFYSELEKYPSLISPVRSYKDIINNMNLGKLSALLTIEEGAVIKGDLAFLRTFYRLGVRMMTLTWNFPNELGSPNVLHDPDWNPDTQTPNIKDGLTAIGIETVQEMERIGIIVDVSHLSDAGFWDVVKYSSKPFVASHSNARAICNHTRNLTDQMIRALANRGGVMGLNFGANFLRNAAWDDPSTIESMIYQLKHIVNIGGINCVGLGSDFDGIHDNLEIGNAAGLPILAAALKKAGFTEDSIEHIFNKNVLQLYKELL